MKKYWYWIELIGFDKNNVEQSIDTFLQRTGGAEGVSLLLFSVDFVNSFTAGNDDAILPPQVCSYAAHSSNGERRRQEWRKKDLKQLVAGLKSRGIKVLLCVFNMYLYHIDGKEICEGFSNEHREINEVTCDGDTYQVVSMLKHLSDGSDYGDYFIQKLTAALEYYGFDGVQVGDGISSARLTVEQADYSDDTVSMFLAQGGTLPEGVSARVGNDPDAIAARARRIFGEIRSEWTKFVSDLWGDFIKRLTRALKKQNKYVLLNTTWTREPTEAYIRYGMDYAKAFDENIDALMVEENAQTMAEGGVMHYGGVKANLARRARLAYEGYVMQLAIKSMFRSLPQITMCPIRDNEEQFDTLRCAYTEITKSSALRNMAVCFDGNGYVPVSSNLLYTLSDAVTESEWRDLHGLEEKFAFENVRCENGVLAVFNAENTVKEAERYFKSRALASSEIYVRAIMGGLPISGGCSVWALETCKQPVIVANAELYGEKELALLEKYEYPLFTVGYAKALGKQADAVFLLNGNNGFAVYGYNLKTKKNADYGIRYPAPDLTKRETGRGIFTAPLQYEKIPKRFFASVAKEIVRMLGLPVLKSGTGCKCFPTRINGKDACVITNDSYFYELPTVDVGKAIAGAKALSKIDDYRVATEGGKFSVLVNNRGAETVVLTLKNDKDI